MPFPELNTERLLLRKLEKADASCIFRLRNNAQVNEYLDRPLALTLDDAEHFIDNILNGIQAQKWFYWAIERKTDRQMIGTICLWNISESECKAEIGYELLPEYQGKGIMSEASGKIIEYGFSKLQLKTIEAYTHPDNERSVKLLEKAGFRRENAHSPVQTATKEVLFVLTAEQW